MHNSLRVEDNKAPVAQRVQGMGTPTIFMKTVSCWATQEIRPAECESHHPSSPTLNPARLEPSPAYVPLSRAREHGGSKWDLSFIPLSPEWTEIQPSPLKSVLSVWHLSRMQWLANTLGAWSTQAQATGEEQWGYQGPPILFHQHPRTATSRPNPSRLGLLPRPGMDSLPMEASSGPTTSSAEAPLMAAPLPFLATIDGTLGKQAYFLNCIWAHINCYGA